MTIATLIITSLTLFLVLCLVIGALVVFVSARSKMQQRKAVAASITPEMREKLTKMFSGLGGETK